MDKLFEQGTRLKVRFESAKGLLSIEELWDLKPIATRQGEVDLDTVAKAVNKQLNDAQEVSFVKTKSSANTLLQLKLDILVYIINVKLAEEEESKVKSAKLAHKELLLELKANKQMQALQSLSLEDIDKQLAELG
jgi:hypothetical protein